MALAGATAFAAVFERGRRLDGRYMQLIVATGERPPSRAGFVISRKALRRAVDRNRLRRQVRAMLVARAAEATEPFDVVVRVKPPLSRSDLPAAADEARRLVARLG
ncbi:MAG TPA: ribonuclease P protein component [Casimicrobiaceae bacterium]|nr:ribonuclease P protein component [Casimicrobiaceae bacterium]